MKEPAPGGAGFISDQSAGQKLRYSETPGRAPVVARIVVAAVVALVVARAIA